MVVKKKCAWCGRSFLAGRKDQLYDTKACTMAAWREKKAEEKKNVEAAMLEQLAAVLPKSGKKVRAFVNAHAGLCASDVIPLILEVVHEVASGRS